MKEYYIYEESDKPDDGWIHSCVTCNIFTARILLYESFPGKKIYAYVCNKCKKRIKTDTEYKNYYNECCIKIQLETNLNHLCCLNSR